MRGARNAGEACGRVLIDELVRGGLKHAVISPGSRSTPLALALARDERVASHVVLDERSSGYFALGLARSSGQAVAIVCTSGTAAANLYPAIVEADLSRVPLLVLTADRPPELRDTGANQAIDQIKMYGSTVRWFCEVGVPEARPGSVDYWRSIASRAWASSVGSPPGPVHLNVAFRDPLVPIPDDAGFPYALEGRPDEAPWTQVQRSVGVPSDADVEWLAVKVAATERGLIVAGAGAVDPAPLTELAEVAGWPILAEPASGLRSGPNALSTHDALLRVERWAQQHRPEFVIRLGKPGISKATESLLGNDIEQVLIDADGMWLDPGRSASRMITADPGLLGAAVAKTAPRRSGSAWLAEWTSADRRARGMIDEILDDQTQPSEPRTARDLAASLPRDAHLFVAASMPVRALDWFMAPRQGLNIAANRGANGIDGSVSSALGAAAATGQTAFALIGDLALLHDQNGLSIGSAGDLVAVVLNNDGGGIFSFLPQADLPNHFEELFITPHGIDLGEVARAHGALHARIDRADDLVTEVRRAHDYGGIHLIEVPIDRTESVALYRHIWAEVAAAV